MIVCWCHVSSCPKNFVSLLFCCLQSLYVFEVGLEDLQRKPFERNIKMTM